MISAMSVAKIIEISASSPNSFEEAVQEGITRAHETLKHVQSAWIQDQQVQIENGKITEYRVIMKVTFILKD